MRYDPHTRTVLIVFRAGGEAYLYFDVPREEWREFLAASSKGTYLNHTFKARHECVKVEASRLVENHQRAADEDDDGEQKAELLEWGETWALPERGQ